MGMTQRAGWYKKGYNLETHSTPARAEASKRNALLGGRPKSAEYIAVAALEIGSSCLIKFRLAPDGSLRDHQDWIRGIIRRLSARTGRQFWTRGGASGLIITRRA